MKSLSEISKGRKRRGKMSPNVRDFKVLSYQHNQAKEWPLVSGTKYSLLVLEEM